MKDPEATHLFRSLIHVEMLDPSDQPHRTRPLVSHSIDDRDGGDVTLRLFKPQQRTKR